MSDFCRQCSLLVFGEDYEDHTDYSGPHEIRRVLCEDCGPTYVDRNGLCIYKGCLAKHGLTYKGLGGKVVNENGTISTVD